MHEHPQMKEESKVMMDDKHEYGGANKITPSFDSSLKKQQYKEHEYESGSNNVIKTNNNKITINFKDTTNKSKMDISSTLINSAQNTNLSTPKNAKNLNVDEGNMTKNNFIINSKKPSVNISLTGATTKNNSRKVSEEKALKEHHKASNIVNYNNTILNSQNKISGVLVNHANPVQVYPKENYKVDSVDFNPKAIISATISSSKVTLKTSASNSNKNSNSNFVLSGKVKKTTPIDITNILRTNIVQSSSKMNLDEKHFASNHNTGKSTPNSKAFLDHNVVNNQNNNVNNSKTNASSTANNSKSLSKNSSHNESKSKIDEINNQIVKNGLKLYDNIQNNLNINKKNLTSKSNIPKKKGQITSMPVSTFQTKNNSKYNSKSENMSKVEIHDKIDKPIEKPVEKPVEKPLENNFFAKPKVSKDYSANVKKPEYSGTQKKNYTTTSSPNHYPMQFNKETSSMISHNLKGNYVNHMNNVNINNNNINSQVHSSKVSYSVSSAKVKEEQKIPSLKIKSMHEPKKESMQNPLNTSNASIVSTIREANYYKSQAESLINTIKTRIFTVLIFRLPKDEYLS